MGTGRDDIWCCDDAGIDEETRQASERAGATGRCDGRASPGAGFALEVDDRRAALHRQSLKIATRIGTAVSAIAAQVGYCGRVPRWPCRDTGAPSQRRAEAIMTRPRVGA